MNALRRIATRTSAFLVKESVVALGQPRLILSLVLGPFLLLFLFGLGFDGGRAPFRTVLVVPDTEGIPLDMDVYRGYFLWALQLEDVSADGQEAFRRLREREVDAVIVAPAHPLRDLAEDRPAVFAVFYNHLDPVDRSRIEGLAFGHTRELNVLLVAAVLDALLQAGGLRESNTTALDELRLRMAAGDSDGALSVLDRLLAAVVILRLSGEGIASVVQSEQATPPTTPPLERFELLLRAVRAEIAPETALTAEQEANLTELEQTALLLPDVVRAAAQVSPQRLAAPVDYTLSNLAPIEISYVRFYAPVVVALLLQHIAVTLASLSTIRERTRGTVELFAVAPLRLTEILAGKALSFTLMLAGVGFVLMLLLVLVLQVPLLGNVLVAAAVLLLLVVASLALGFIVAAISTTEPQTVQFAMLTLLFAIFFGGLFVPVESLEPPIRNIAYLVPVTHAGEALRGIMLRGELTAIEPVLALVLMATALPLVALLFMRTSYGMR